MVLLDKDLREPLFEFLEDSFGKIRILEEKNIGDSRADVVMVTETEVCGIEIKSDADTYVRLAGQVKDYDRYYDRNYVVVGVKHAAHIHEHVPAYWGIITAEEVDGYPDFYILRKPELNPKMKLNKKLEILWRNELALLQEANEMPKYKNESKAFVIGQMLKRIENGKIDIVEFQKQISEVLFERDYTTAAKDLAEYRKGEIAKKLETETDPVKRYELMLQRDLAVQKLGVRKKKVRRRRRRFI